MLQEIIGKLSPAELTILGLLFTLTGTLIGGAVALVTSWINGWFATRQIKHTQEAESERQSRQLAVQLALEHWKTLNEARKADHDRENARMAAQGFVRTEEYHPPYINPIVTEMWRLTEKLKPKEDGSKKQATPPKNVHQSMTWKQWLRWPLDWMREWWLSR